MDENIIWINETYEIKKKNNNNRGSLSRDIRMKKLATNTSIRQRKVEWKSSKMEWEKGGVENIH